MKLSAALLIPVVAVSLSGLASGALSKDAHPAKRAPVVASSRPIASAVPPAAPGPAAPDPGALPLVQDAGEAPPAVIGCVETGFTEGGPKPKLEESFPTRGVSGYAATLKVTVTHGRGESVLPHGLDLQASTEASKVLKSAEFVLPEQDAGFGASLTVKDVPDHTADRMTVLELPVVPLPSKPGRHTLTLPPFPVQVARASGSVVTLCTSAHTIVVEDPTANVADARPKANPNARPQREEWTSLKVALEWIALGSLVGGLLAYLIYRFVTRPRPVPPPPPPRPPWEIALERLDEVRHAGLLETGRIGEFFDRVNDAVRSYLGARYGFDGLESTTDEVMTVLRRVPYFGISIPEISGFLQTCDLVKFAKLLPSYDECRRAIDEGERIVRTTMPTPPQGGPS